MRNRRKDWPFLAACGRFPVTFRHFRCRCMKTRAAVGERRVSHRHRCSDPADRLILNSLTVRGIALDGAISSVCASPRMRQEDILIIADFVVRSLPAISATASTRSRTAVRRLVVVSGPSGQKSDAASGRVINSSSVQSLGSGRRWTRGGSLPALGVFLVTVSLHYCRSNLFAHDERNPAPLKRLMRHR
jgi:hypothetical protein